MQVVEEVAPVESQPSRQLGGPEGEEPPAQIPPADHVEKPLDIARVIGFEGRVHGGAHGKVKVGQESYEEQAYAPQNQLHVRELASVHQGDEKQARGQEQPAGEMVGQGQTNEEGGEQEVTVLPAISPEKEGEQVDGDKQGIEG